LDVRHLATSFFTVFLRLCDISHFPAQLDLKPHLVLLGSTLDISNHTAHTQLPEYCIHTQNTHTSSQKRGRGKKNTGIKSYD